MTFVSECKSNHDNDNDNNDNDRQTALTARLRGRLTAFRHAAVVLCVRAVSVRRYVAGVLASAGDTDKSKLTSDCRLTGAESQRGPRARTFSR